MKTLTPIIQGFATFSAIAWLAHLGTAYELLRFGVVWVFVLGAIASIIYGLCLLAQGFMQQQASENPNAGAALIYCIPAIVLLIMLFFGGLTGVITGW